MNEVELCKYDVCTQCYACKAACPKGCVSMVEAKDGFVVPEIDRDRCVGCGACMKACHRLNPPFEFQKPIHTYACWTKILSDRERSSSGGAFSVLARNVVSQGGIVYGASMCDDLQVKHIGVECQEDIARLQGSKYLQSYLGDTYKQVRSELKTGRKVLFTGTPCQVAGLLTFLHRPYANLYTCDVVCHGVPSQKAFDAYIEKIGLKGKCLDFGFRFTKGWGFQLTAQLKSPGWLRLWRRKMILPPGKCYYLKAFYKGLMFSETCFHCVYARPERVSDITLADYWGLGASLPFDRPTHKGVSCLLVNNEKALAFVKECGELEYEERPLEEAVAGNNNLRHASVRQQGRDTYYEDSLSLTIKELGKKYGIGRHRSDYRRMLRQFVHSLR